MKRRPRPLVWFWLLAPLATGVLLWSSYQALIKERATNASRMFWNERSAIGGVITELDHAVLTLLSRESARAPDDYQSYREATASVPGAMYKGEPLAELDNTPAWLPSPFFAESQPSAPKGFARLHFQLLHKQDATATDGGLSIPAAPIGQERQLSLARGHATPESIARAESLGAQLAERIGIPVIARVAREAARLPEPPLGAGANFAAFLFEARGKSSATGAELVALRLVDTPDAGRVLQGIWYDWPRLRVVLETLAQNKLGSGEISLAPAGRLLKSGAAAPPHKAIISRSGGQLANVALDVSVGGRPTLTPPIWTGTAQSLAAAWLVVLAALFAIHHSLVRAAALSERRARFASAVTHELRTPLTTLCMYAEMLSAGLVQDDQRADYYKTLKREADRLAALVDNVLDHAGLESGRTAKLQPLELATWLAGLASHFEQAGAHLETEPDGALDVLADASGLERILTNLVDNAKKYGSQPITLRLSRAADRAELRVVDAGAGIAHPKRIFQAFTREKGAPRAKEAGSSTRGLGLGLAISRDLARAMGGELTLEHPGPCSVTKGKSAARDAAPTTFLLSLPLRPHAT